MARILLVDDEPNLVWAVQNSLADEGYEVLSTGDGVEALAVARRHHPDLIVLDILMPGMNGLQVCHNLRRDPTLAAIPILFLTALSAIGDRVTGLDQGGDDYLIKPFSLAELKARIRALLRRGQTAAASGPADWEARLVVGPLTLDLHACQVSVGGQVMGLTPIEFNLLRHLMTYPSTVFSSEQLLQQVWGYAWGTADPSLVRWHIKNLRAKIEPDPAQPTYLRTIPRHGYLLAVALTPS
ncbi:MAG: response regulator transcription factor [Chloroflexi bacterium]|nr:response regulator transcription factor [Chloroflexota bacterium]MBU1751524.1 response regulator transcription factor [Chloroflexota bacterium]